MKCKKFSVDWFKNKSLQIVNNTDTKLNKLKKIKSLKKLAKEKLIDIKEMEV